jgi:electron transport complex protein RnfD
MSASGSDFLKMELRTSPHAKRPVDTVQIMRNVVYALIPIVLYSVYAFGISALLVIAASVFSCLVTEAVMCRFFLKTENTLGDYSAWITGILLGLTLPPGFPLWMACVGGVVSIVLGKGLFGGLGANVFNPALVGRAFLQAAFPVAITTWNPVLSADRFSRVFDSTLAFPFTKFVPDAVTGATPLSLMKFDHQVTATSNLFMGQVMGSLGEVSAILIILCGLYLAVRKMLDWRIPVGIFGSVYVLSALFHAINPENPSPQFMLFSGGLMLGAFFMATDMVSSPVTSAGTWLYAILIGGLVVCIRLWGGLPEGVMYAILLGNAVTPILNGFTQPRVYGTVRRAS